MKEREDPDVGEATEPLGREDSDLPSPDHRSTDVMRPKGLSQLPAIIVPTLRADRRDEPSVAPPGTVFGVRLAAAAAIAVAGLGVGASWLAMDEHRRQASVIAEHSHQTEALARTVDGLTMRLNALDSAKAHDELVELRRSIGEIRSSSASSLELGNALAQLSQRVDKLDHEASTKVDRLGERFDHEASAQAAELSARIEKLEKKVVAVAAPAPSPPANTTSPSKQPTSPPGLGPNVSMETTGSIERSRPVLRRYVVLGARNDVALIDGRDGERAVRPGDFLPGAGRVERIERTEGGWVVLTEQGVIGTASPY
jgi:hypothetical protein